MHFFTIAFDAHPVLGKSPAGRQQNGSAIDFDHTDHTTGQGLTPFQKTHCGNVNSEFPGGVKNGLAVWNFYFTIVDG
jgi:hypothetical protein